MTRRSFFSRLLAAIPGSQFLSDSVSQQSRYSEVQELMEKIYSAPGESGQFLMLCPGDPAYLRWSKVEALAWEDQAEQRKTLRWSMAQSAPEASEPQRDRTDESLESHNTYGVHESPSDHSSLEPEAICLDDGSQDLRPLVGPTDPTQEGSEQPELDQTLEQTTNHQSQHNHL